MRTVSTAFSPLWRQSQVASSLPRVIAGPGRPRVGFSILSISSYSQSSATLATTRCFTSSSLTPSPSSAFYSPSTYVGDIVSRHVRAFSSSAAQSIPDAQDPPAPSIEGSEECIDGLTSRVESANPSDGTLYSLKDPGREILTINTLQVENLRLKEDTAQLAARVMSQSIRIKEQDVTIAQLKEEYRLISDALQAKLDDWYFRNLICDYYRRIRAGIREMSQKEGFENEDCIKCLELVLLSSDAKVNLAKTDPVQYKEYLQNEANYHKARNFFTKLGFDHSFILKLKKFNDDRNDAVHFDAIAKLNIFSRKYSDIEITLRMISSMLELNESNEAFGLKTEMIALLEAIAKVKYTTLPPSFKKMTNVSIKI